MEVSQIEPIRQVLPGRYWTECCTLSSRKRCVHCMCPLEAHVVASKEEKEGIKGKPGASFSYSWQPSELHTVEEVSDSWTQLK